MTGEKTSDEMPAVLRAARAYAQLSQDEVAEALGVSSGTVSAWERGRTTVPTIARPGVLQGLRKMTGLDDDFFDQFQLTKEEK